jgi:L-2-hydroxyglutarate oxidase LhgO
VLNCAGHGAQQLATRIDGLAPRTIPAGAKVKGGYFSLSGRAPFSRLIYPFPNPTRLGVHLAFDLSGRACFEPDAEAVEELDYHVDPTRTPLFYSAVRQYWPGLADDALLPDYAGVRPVLNGIGGPKVDFVIQGSKEHGIKGLINLYGIESSGLMASPAIAEEVLTTVA